MPKLNGTHIYERLRKRLEQLRNGEEVARRELETLLTTQQVEAWDAAWDEQKRLPKSKRARTKKGEAAFGRKSKREITIEAIQAALNESEDGLVDELERLQKEATKRQMRIYMDTMAEALKAGKDEEVAKNLANNALTQAGLNRMDAFERQIEEVKQQRILEGYMRLAQGRGTRD